MAKHGTNKGLAEPLNIESLQNFRVFVIAPLLLPPKAALTTLTSLTLILPGGNALVKMGKVVKMVKEAKMVNELIRLLNFDF